MRDWQAEAPAPPMPAEESWGGQYCLHSLTFPRAVIERGLVGRTPGPRGTPSSRRRHPQGASRPTGASAADQGVRPTNRAASTPLPLA
jgi:hypothetical protein